MCIIGREHVYCEAVKMHHTEKLTLNTGSFFLVFLDPKISRTGNDRVGVFQEAVVCLQMFFSF